jgi:heme/copper-type cytochrome/quinol oxidase subunit 3
MSEGVIICVLGWSSYQSILSPLYMTHNLWLLIVCVNSYDLWLKNTNVLSVSAIFLGYHSLKCMSIWFINCYLCSFIFIEGQVLEFTWLCIHMSDCQMGWMFFCIDGLHLSHMLIGNMLLCLLSGISSILGLKAIHYLSSQWQSHQYSIMQWVYWHLVEQLWLCIYYVCYV